MRWAARPVRTLTTAGSLTALTLTTHTVWNLRQLRRPPRVPAPLGEDVVLLLPLRDEAHRVRPCLAALRAVLALDPGHLSLRVLDDRSGDGTRDVVEQELADVPGVQVHDGVEPPPGWLGKPHACAQLADLAGRADVLVFLDADVVLEPDAVRASVALLREAGLDLVSPYPRQVATGLGQRLVQPLLQWSWATTLPLRLAESSARSSLSVANGQLMAVDAAAYRRAGGHAAVRASVLEDLALVRAVKAAGGRGTVADGSGLASCTMYATWGDLVQGYGKSLWSAFGPSRPVSAVVAAGLLAVYVLPALAALGGSPVGALGWTAGVVGRVAVARRTGSRAWPDALAHPVSVLVFCGLLARSWRAHDRGTLRWRGRPVVAQPSARTCPSAAGAG